MQKEWLYEKTDDNSSRFVLGTVGVNPLVCFGINPSTAEPNNLDNTLKSVERITLSNGFDSFIMFNVYPQRATDPNNLHLIFDENLHNQNLIAFENTIKGKNIPIWAAWGTLIGKREYLFPCLFDIVNISKKYGCAWLTAGKKSKAGHPHHPLYLRKDEAFAPFDIDSYLDIIK